MEFEVRFYYPETRTNEIINNLNNINELSKKERTYEKTIQYNHSDSRYNFYSKEIDGRFRFRVSGETSKLSWKRRLPDTTDTLINKEEEIEVHIDINDANNFMYIIENVMHFKVVESYERYRTIYENDDIEISVDEYPFGTAIEIENKSTTKNPEYNVGLWVKRLGIDIKDAYRLSWDDKYQELCLEQNKTVYNEVTFDKDMPKVR